MIATIHLTTTESEALQSLSQQTGKTVDELLHDAVETLIRKPSTAEMLARIPGAKRMWRDRDDLPGLRELRGV